jgi:hypothetical protein
MKYNVLFMIIMSVCLCSLACMSACEEKKTPAPSKPGGNESPTRSGSENTTITSSTSPQAQTVWKTTTTRVSDITLLAAPPTGSTDFVVSQVTFGTLSDSSAPAVLKLDQGQDAGVQILDGFAFRQQGGSFAKLRGPRVRITVPSLISDRPGTSDTQIALRGGQESALIDPPMMTPIPDFRYLIAVTPTAEYFFVTDVPNVNGQAGSVTLEAGGNYVVLAECQYVVLDTTGTQPSWRTPAPLPTESSNPTGPVGEILARVKLLTNQSFYNDSCNGLGEAASRTEKPAPENFTVPSIDPTKVATIIHKTRGFMWIDIKGQASAKPDTWAFGANETTPAVDATLVLADVNSDLEFDESVVESGFAFASASSRRSPPRTPRIKLTVGSAIPKRSEQEAALSCAQYSVLTIAGQKKDYIFVPQTLTGVTITLTNNNSITLQSCQWTSFDHTDLKFSPPAPLPKQGDGTEEAKLLDNVKVKSGVSYFFDPACGCK